jgi:predicted nucleic acid-binding protein
VPFSLDTSGILDAWVRYYPPDVFPTIWSQMDVSAKNGEIFVIEEVVRELEKKDDGIHGWIKERETIIVPIDDEVQKHVVQIMSKYSRLVDTKKNRSVGDPWVVALALVRGLTVVTGEKASGNLAKPKIPDVCKDLGLSCLEMVDFFRKQGWRW